VGVLADIRWHCSTTDAIGVSVGSYFTERQAVQALVDRAAGRIPAASVPDAPTRVWPQAVLPFLKPAEAPTMRQRVNAALDEMAGERQATPTPAPIPAPQAKTIVWADEQAADLTDAVASLLKRRTR